ncbi:hypothetical protein [Metabacillus arenae]|uniref:Uncharacterized protein n=1 Tax=Metabacillus arenae TaxID=2771434 RepID=A0A926NJL6_9BACI|nr:hypothetical protein [Metabacillus arenae]MBD1379056.1 hypothetical protein [Metabacillus arenae]
MLEIPSLLVEFFKNMLFDFGYFSSFMLNGGWAGIFGTVCIIYLLRIFIKDLKE